MKKTDEAGAVVTNPEEGDMVYLTFDVPIAGQTIRVSADTYPGTYYITGDTFARSEVTGKDEYFQFIVPKGKVISDNTITLEAEGDPSVFNMSVEVLRAEGGDMIQLVKYALTDDTLPDGP